MAKLPVGYRQRADGTIESRFTVNGKRYSCYASTVKECRIKETELREQIRNGLYASNRNITLNQYFEEWEKSRQCSVKESTQIRIRSQYNSHIRNTLGKKKIVNIERREVQLFQQELLSKVQPSTANNIFIVLQMILKCAVIDDIIVKSPAAGIKALMIEDKKKASKTIHRALTRGEQAQFMEEAKKAWLYEYMAFLLCTGVRMGEAAALTWQDIDYTNNVIHISKTTAKDVNHNWVITSPKSKTSVRDIPLNDTIKDILRKQREKMAVFNGNIIELSQTIFKGSYGAYVSDVNINYEIRSVLKRLEKKGIKIERFTCHAFRDTFATRYIEEGGSAQVLKTILGHSSLAMTMDLYSHVMPDTKQQEMELIENAFKMVTG